ncbi:nuclear transport factor 2 family protein [Natrinema thermotolerans]|uniref:Nuclear transport factor 2 family protein n=1 Tax=Natrinema thermotolerans TaxID=121872 RepID=A0AAF0PDK9_9EURY|nr:nuclear transport factor 2 family protein [Natrinema thermotolerans]QCC59759.1 nuclear transport factor 2 family protein [Natrinema thermotolerans]WMT06748.1 nuclear transport factor 2 family protein [Natrinema thermotolerans]
MNPATLVRRYYDVLDDHDYEALETILDPEFVQRRPDRTFDDRAAFVAFMRDERPNPDTDHELETVIADGDRVAVQGRVVDDGATLFEFADVFELADDRIVRLETYSR